MPLFWLQVLFEGRKWLIFHHNTHLAERSARLQLDNHLSQRFCSIVGFGSLGIKPCFHRPPQKTVVSILLIVELAFEDRNQTKQTTRYLKVSILLIVELAFEE